MNGKYLPRLPLASLFIVIAVQIGGFALLWSKDAPPPEYVYLPATADRTAADLPVNTPVVVVSPPDEKALREIIQAVLKQELASYAQQNASTSSSAAPMRSPPTKLADVKENTPANIQALTESTSITQSAIASGEWTEKDALALTLVARHLSMEQRLKIMNELATAVNRQELKLEAALPAL